MQGERNQTWEELDLIRLYVDQLEDRLVDYAIARKEIDAKEKGCASTKRPEEERTSWEQSSNADFGEKLLSQATEMGSTLKREWESKLENQRM